MCNALFLSACLTDVSRMLQRARSHGEYVARKIVFTIQGLVVPVGKQCTSSDLFQYTSSMRNHQLSGLLTGNRRKVVAFLLNQGNFLGDTEFEVGLKGWLFLNGIREYEARELV